MTKIDSKIILSAFVLFFALIPTFALAGEHRIEGTVGYNYGNFSYDEKLEDDHDANLDNIGTGGGVYANAAYWYDKAFGVSWLSLGLQYNYISGEVSYSFDNVGNNKNYNGKLERESNNIMFNVAARKNDGDIHPYIGAGIGYNNLKVKGFSQIDETILGVTTLKERIEISDSDGIVSGQIFVGVDYDVTDNIYLGFDTKFMISSGKLVGWDVTHQTLCVGVKIGYRF